MDTQIFIGRAEEQATLQALYLNKEADLVAVLGRRRVGKTFLIKQTFNMKFDFYFTGIKNSDKEATLAAFVAKIQEYAKLAYPLEVPDNWFSAFELLKKYLSSKKLKQKKVIFLDELPWMDTHLSNFLPALEYFWNHWAVDQNIIIVICGSATSWMIDNIRNNSGGLHNRVSKYLYIEPFTLADRKSTRLNPVT